MTKLALSKEPIAMLEDFDSDPDIIMLVDDEQDDARRPYVTISPDFIVTIHSKGQSNDPHYNNLLRLARRMKVSLKNIRYQLSHLKTPLTAEEERFYRMRFFNIRAIGLMLELGIPEWQNCKDDEALLQQFAKARIIPPLDEWQADWLTFAQYCADTQYQRRHCKEVQQNKANKMTHIASLKAMKAKALLDAAFPQAEGNAGAFLQVGIDFSNSIVVTKRQNLKITFDGFYTISLCIDGTRIQFHLTYSELDRALPLVIDGLRRINDLVPAFGMALAADSEAYGQLYLLTHYNQLCSFAFHPEDSTPIYYLSFSANRRRSGLGGASLGKNVDPPPTSLTSSTLLAQINAVVRDVRFSISAANRSARRQQSEKAN